MREPYKAKWSAILNNVENDEWQHYHITLFQCTRNTKLQAFQFKIIHNILATKQLLKLCKITETDSCTFCNREVETTSHLLFNCPCVKKIWGELVGWLEPVLDISDLITERNILLGSFSNHLINLILLVTKYYVYCCKFREVIPNINGIKGAIRQEYRVEQRIAKGDVSRVNRFNAKWNTIEGLLTGM